MIKKILWYSIATISVVGIIIFTVGFFKAVSLTTGTQNEIGQSTESLNEDTVQEQKNTLKLTILGDSVAKGTGDETGRGFAGNLEDALNSITSKEITVENLGIDGLRSAALLESFQNKSLTTLLEVSDFILISIGGNDLRTLQNQDDTTKEQGIDALQNQYISDLKEIIQSIRESNKDATIVFVGLYNPYITTGSFVDGSLVRSWNYNTQQLIEADDFAVFVSTYDLIKFNAKKYISVDGLHPNAVGYQEITNRIVNAIEGLIVNN